jgi:hypothetical protein
MALKTSSDEFAQKLVTFPGFSNICPESLDRFSRMHAVSGYSLVPINRRAQTPLHV